MSLDAHVVSILFRYQTHRSLLDVRSHLCSFAPCSTDIKATKRALVKGRLRRVAVAIQRGIKQRLECCPTSLYAKRMKSVPAFSKMGSQDGVPKNDKPSA